MHTWALFSCSGLVTLTAYNLTQLPNQQPAEPEPEPEPSSQAATDTKFTLGDLSQQFPEQSPTPTIATQPQLSPNFGALTVYDPTAYDPAPYQADPVDLTALLPTVPRNEVMQAYHTEAIANVGTPSPSSLPVVSMTAPPATDPLATLPPHQPVTSSLPVPETLAPAPTFASEVVAVQADTDEGEVVAEAAAVTAIATTAPLAIPPMVAYRPDWVRLEAADQAVATDGTPLGSMQTAQARYQLLVRLCARSRQADKVATRPAVCEGDTREFAQSIPEAATAGTPIPGKVLSPTRSNPAMGVWPLGKSPAAAVIAGP